LTSDPLRKIVYTPDSQLLHVRQLLKSIVQDLISSRELAWRLFVRNISAQYRQSFLGYIWAFLPPIATTLIWVFLNSQQILDVGTTDIPYPAFVMIGTLLWQGFVDALNSPIKLITSSKSMLAKINFPHEALILAGMGEVIFNFLIRVVLVIIVFIWFKIPVPATIIFAPIGIAGLMILGFMIGVFLAPLGVLYQDVQRGLEIITRFWFFMTPVIYPLPTDSTAAFLTKLNPVTPLLVTSRELMTTGEVTQSTSFIIVTALSLAFTVTGWILYRLAKPHLIQRMST